jgi:hypothetical protein
MNCALSQAAFAFDWATCPTADALSKAKIQGNPILLPEEENNSSYVWFSSAGKINVNHQNWYVSVWTEEINQNDALTNSKAALKSIVNNPFEFTYDNQFICFYGTTVNDHTAISATTFSLK